jgi:hypothetical protein
LADVEGDGVRSEGATQAEPAENGRFRDGHVDIDGDLVWALSLGPGHPCPVCGGNGDLAHRPDCARSEMVARRLLVDGTELVVYRMYGEAMDLALTLPGNNFGVDERWTYAPGHFLAAVAGMILWEPNFEPTGWIRHRPSDRRRPDGDPSREYIRP